MLFVDMYKHESGLVAAGGKRQNNKNQFSFLWITYMFGKSKYSSESVVQLIQWAI